MRCEYNIKTHIDNNLLGLSWVRGVDKKKYPDIKNIHSRVVALHLWFMVMHTVMHYCLHC